MELTVLVDNNTLIDRYFLGEPGVCYLLEEDGKRILFDTGYSNAFLINAHKMGIDLLQLDYVVLSHGHLDHTWGLDPLIRMQTEASIEGSQLKRPELVAHPTVFVSKSMENVPEAGSMLSEEKLSRHFRLSLSKTPAWLTERLVFLGEIERLLDFEASGSMGRMGSGSGIEEDYLLDDSGLAYRSDDGLVIIVGCSHAGICNITEQAKRICQEDRVVDIIGGLHLLNPSQERLKHTVQYLKALNLKSFHPCHCTDLASKIALSEAAPLKEVGVGLRVHWH